MREKKRLLGEVIGQIFRMLVLSGFNDEALYSLIPPGRPNNLRCGWDGRKDQVGGNRCNTRDTTGGKKSRDWKRGLPERVLTGFSIPATDTSVLQTKPDLR